MYDGSDTCSLSMDNSKPHNFLIQNSRNEDSTNDDQSLNSSWYSTINTQFSEICKENGTIKNSTNFTSRVSLNKSGVPTKTSRNLIDQNLHELSTIKEVDTPKSEQNLKPINPLNKSLTKNKSNCNQFLLNNSYMTNGTNDICKKTVQYKNILNNATPEDVNAASKLVSKKYSKSYEIF